MNLTQRLARPFAVTAALALFATGCGGDDGRPSVDEISQSLQDEDLLGSDMDAKLADCIAEAFHDSDLSDEALRAIAEGDEDYDASEEDEKAVESISTGAMRDCVTEGLDVPSDEDLGLPEEDPEAS